MIFHFSFLIPYNIPITSAKIHPIGIDHQIIVVPKYEASI